MKKLLPLLVVLFTLNAFAQNSPHKVVRATQAKAILPVMPGKIEISGANQKGPAFAREAAENIKLYTREILDLVQLNDSIYQWKWDTFANDWTLFAKNTDITYNQLGSITNYTTQLLTGSNWVNSVQIQWTYDQNNYPSTYVYRIWNGTSWAFSFRYLYVYDANGNQLENTYQSWTNGMWVNYYKFITTYNADDNELTGLQQNWNGTSWDNFDLYTYTYDSKKNLLTQLHQSFNDINLTWDNTDQSVFVYDGNNNEISQTDQTWNGLNWDDQNRDTYTYTPGNLVATDISQYYDGATWLNSLKYTYTYNPSGTVANQFGQYWNSTNWDNYSRYNYTYNAADKMIRAVFEDWYGGSWVKAALNLETYDNNSFLQAYSSVSYDEDDNSVTQGDSLYYFYHAVSGTNNLPSDGNSISVYPNPGNGQMVISSDKKFNAIRINNLLGQQVYANEKTNDQTSVQVDLSIYGKGMYVITISDGAQRYFKKILVE